MRSTKGFTLVEILIVVVILGILAAIVIPQFTDASTEAKTSSLCSDLQSMRSQIELYKIQHNDNLPGINGVTFEESMTGYTLNDGSLADPQAPGDGVYGPYLQKLPSNQFISIAANQNDVTSAATTPAAPDGTSGWIYNTVTGEVKANDTYDSNVHWSL
ncbi:MAG: prepilin-type N-terminal cleavage/methylation domain-containing protein [Sedimentisphaerales bacterium]|nr:prepilin-type N-terminal cleavage/methylation domain-containing protein [Sedimentisphaerales bacterium]